MKKIAYIEIDTHAEIAADFMDLMQDSHGFSVDYFFSKKIKKQVAGDSQHIFLSDQSTILDQLKKKQYDLIIIGTVHRYFSTFLSITKKYKTALIVHNLNFSRTSGLDLIKNMFKDDFVYRLKLMLKEGLFNASQVYRRAHQLFVLDPVLSSSEHQFLPLFYTKKLGRNQNEKLTVVIPGGVSQKRRHYRHVLEQIQTSQVAKNMQFVFLGKAKGEELYGIKKLSENFDLVYFTERVSQNDFEFWMKKADVLWCPIQQKTEFFSQEEIYGKTKMTGNIGDAIKFGKMAVFPSAYCSDFPFIIPEKENVIQQFHELKDADFDFQKEYSKENVLKNLEQKLKDLI